MFNAITSGGLTDAWYSIKNPNIDTRRTAIYQLPLRRSDAVDYVAEHVAYCRTEQRQHHDDNDRHQHQHQGIFNHSLSLLTVSTLHVALPPKTQGQSKIKNDITIIKQVGILPTLQVC